MRTVRDLKIGEKGVVKKLHGEGPLKRRIMDMGITKGVAILIRKDWRVYKIIILKDSYIIHEVANC